MGFQSVAVLAKRAQYKVTQNPVAYSITGGIHNAGGKLCRFRFRIEIAEAVGWKLGDCVDVRTDPIRDPDDEEYADMCRLWGLDPHARPYLVEIVKSEKRGYKLFVSSKRNGISSYHVGIRWQDSLGFPNVYTQIGCDVVATVEGGMIVRIRTEDDAKPAAGAEHKEATSVEGDAFGFMPRTVTHRFPDVEPASEIRKRLKLDEATKRAEKAEEKIRRVREIAQSRPARKSRKGKEQGK